MRVAIAGAGAVGRSIAARLVENGHKVLLIERQRSNFEPRLVPGAEWMFADACEIDKLRSAGIEMCDVVAATAGDDKVNLVFALLCKTEFAVRRVVARVNNPANAWLFTESWGVDVAVDTPSRVVAAVEEAVAIGEVVPLLALGRGAESIVEVRLAPDSPLVGCSSHELELPDGTRLVAVVRSGAVLRPGPSDAALRFEADDEVIAVVPQGAEPEARILLAGGVPSR